MFMGLFVVLAAVLLGFVTWHSEASARIAGYVLQFIGMVFTIRGLLGVRAHFGQPLLRHLFVNWIKQFPKWKRNVVINADSEFLVMTGMKASAEVWTPDDPNKPTEQRIEAILKNLERIRNEQQEHTNWIAELKESHEEQKKQVAEQNKKLREDIHSDLESLHTSDLITSLVGLICLTVGITMSTFALEFSNFLY